MSRLYFEILSEEQKKTLISLKIFSKHGFLGGGTALAIQLTHRRSYDFDIFCPTSISRGFFLKVKEHFKKFQILINTSDELSLVSSLGVKISFIFYPFKPLYKIIPTAGLGIYSWKDIALDKAYTLGRRGEWRDYIDIYFILKAGFSLKKIIKQAEKKFGDSFSKKLFLSQLCYFGDIKDYSIELLKREITPSHLQRFFEEEIKKMELIRL
ncbi:MAG: nucleotidyl transferase AbiEii/AbiGii toxin family protein [Nitrospirota bacterium]